MSPPKPAATSLLALMLNVQAYPMEPKNEVTSAVIIVIQAGHSRTVETTTLEKISS